MPIQKSTAQVQQGQLPLLGGWAKPPTERIAIDGQWIEFQIQRSAKRRTLTLVSDRKGLRVLAPVTISDTHIFTFIREKKRWVFKRLAELEAKPSENVLWVMGQVFTVARLSKQSTEKPGLDVLRCTLWVRPTDDVMFVACQAVSDLAKREIAKRLPHWASNMHLPLPRWKMSKAETRWGSCNQRTGLRFSWKLGCVFPMLIDYVIVHELAHLRYMDHSRCFWHEVEQYYPSWRLARDQLRDFEKKLIDW